jgi:hypothetical protein
MEDVTTRQGVSRNHLLSLTTIKTRGRESTGMMVNFKPTSWLQKRLKKYYQKMFCYLLDVVCLNAVIIYTKGGSISRLDFLVKLAESLSSMGEWWNLQLGVAHLNHPTFSTPWTLLPRQWCQ